MQTEKRYPAPSLGEEFPVLLPARFIISSLSLSIFIVLITVGPSFADASDLWRALRSGDHFAIMRHALAPGAGDPPHFALGQCSTQRNLSDEGRLQAKRIGERFRAHGIEKAHVYSSQWCRCLETAKLLSLGSVQELSALNSFFQKYEREASQTQCLKEWIGAQALNSPLVLVTHQVNITALTRVYPASGEIVVVKRSKAGALSVVGNFLLD